MDTSKVVITGLVVVLIIGGIYVVSQSLASDVAVELNMVDQQKEAQVNEQLANAEAEAKNGVMVGGSMMLPTLTIVDNALRASNVTTLVAAVKAAGLVDTLKGPGPFTVFAPTNAAFSALASGTVAMLLRPENKAQLEKILAYHVVPGRYTGADLKDGQKLKTVQGQELTITKEDNKLMVNDGTMVETADVISSNGVTFIVNGVLMPK